MFGFKRKHKNEEIVGFDSDKFKNTLITNGLSENQANDIASMVTDSINDRTFEKAEMSYDNFMQAITSNVEGLSILPTERMQACRELSVFLSENPEVNNSIRLYASYIAYGAAETKLEEYKVTVIGDDAEKTKKAEKYIKQWERRTKIKRTIYPLAKDLIPFGDAFLEKIYINNNGSKTLAGIAYIPANTIFPKINNKGYPLKYYQIIEDKEAKFADANEIAISSMVQNGKVIEFERNEIVHFSDGSAIGVTDTPYYNLIILWRYLKMLEESLVIHRMTRARRFIVFFLDVTGKTREEIKSAIGNFTQRVKSVFKMDVKKGSIMSTKSTVPSSSDLVIPVVKDSATKIQNIPSDPSATNTTDLSFYLERLTTNMFTSHVFNNSKQTGNEKYIEKSFMRLVKIYQRQMEYELEDLYNEILREKGYEELEVKIQFPSPDSEQEIRIVDSIVRRMMIINQLTATIGVTPPTKWIVNYVFKDLSQYEIEDLIIMLEQAIKEQEESQQGEEYPDIFDESQGEQQVDNSQDDASLRDQGEEGNEQILESIDSDLISKVLNMKGSRVTEKSNRFKDMESMIKLSLEYMKLHNK